MRILVSGGTGFIGRPLVNALKEAGHEVFVLTRQSALVTSGSGYIDSIDALDARQIEILEVQIAEAVAPQVAASVNQHQHTAVADAVQRDVTLAPSLVDLDAGSRELAEAVFYPIDHVVTEDGRKEHDEKHKDERCYCLKKGHLLKFLCVFGSLVNIYCVHVAAMELISNSLGGGLPLTFAILPQIYSYYAFMQWMFRDAD